MSSVVPAVAGFVGVVLGAGIAFIGELIKMDARRKEWLLTCWAEWFEANESVSGAEQHFIQVSTRGHMLFVPQLLGAKIEECAAQLREAQRRQNSAYARLLIVEDRGDLAQDAESIGRRNTLEILQPMIGKEPPDRIDTK